MRATILAPVPDACPPLPRLARAVAVRPPWRGQRRAGEHAAGVPGRGRPRLPLPRDRRARHRRRRGGRLPRRRPDAHVRPPRQDQRAAVERGAHARWSTARHRSRRWRSCSTRSPTPASTSTARPNDARRRARRRAEADERDSTGCASPRSPTAGSSGCAPRCPTLCTALGPQSLALLRSACCATPPGLRRPGARQAGPDHGDQRASSSSGPPPRRRGARVDHRRRRPRWTGCSTSASTGS